MCRAAGGGCGGIAEEREDEATWPRGAGEGIERCAEGGYCLKRDCHLVGLGPVGRDAFLGAVR